MFHRFAGFGRWRRVVDKTAAWLRLRRSCRLVVPGEAGTSLPVWFFTCVLVSAAVYAVAHYVTRRDGVEEITELMKSGMCLYETPRSVYCRGTEGCDLVLPDGTVARASSGGMADGANGENGNASLDTAAAASRLLASRVPSPSSGPGQRGLARCERARPSSRQHAPPPSAAAPTSRARRPRAPWRGSWPPLSPPLAAGASREKGWLGVQQVQQRVIRGFWGADGSPTALVFCTTTNSCVWWGEAGGW